MKKTICFLIATVALLICSGCSTIDTPILSDLVETTAQARIWNNRNLETRGSVAVENITTHTHYHYYGKAAEGPQAPTQGQQGAAASSPALEINIGTGKAHQDNGGGGLNASQGQEKKGLLDRLGLKKERPQPDQE